VRSYGQLWEKIVAEENLLAAWERVRCGHYNNNSQSANRNNNPSNSNNNCGFRLSSTLPGTCQSPARDASAPQTAETNMQCADRPVAQATATSAVFDSPYSEGFR